MKNKLISIIIPVYNSEKGIKETIDTIILQNDIKLIVGKIEVIIVDNNSSDNTFNIANDFSKDNSFIKVIKQKGKIDTFRMHY